MNSKLMSAEFELGMKLNVANKIFRHSNQSPTLIIRVCLTCYLKSHLSWFTTISYQNILRIHFPQSHFFPNGDSVVLSISMELNIMFPELFLVLQRSMQKSFDLILLSTITNLSIHIFFKISLQFVRCYWSFYLNYSSLQQ